MDFERVCPICRKNFSTPHSFVVCCSVPCGQKRRFKGHIEERTCFGCEKIINLLLSKIKRNKSGKFFCSWECWKTKAAMENHPYWKGGKHIGPDGYTKVRVHSDLRRGKSYYELEHRIVMEAHLGRQLLSGENIHHKNGIRSDNRIENLELWTRSQVPGQRVQDLISFVSSEYNYEYREHRRQLKKGIPFWDRFNVEATRIEPSEYDESDSLDCPSH